MFLATSGALAASPEVRSSVYSSSSSVKSVDNSYIRSVNVDSYPFSIEIASVKEDSDSYYVSYILHTIGLVDSVWRDANLPKTLTVAKEALHGGNLGSFVSQELAQVRDAERERLKETQEIERKIGASDKVVSTTYAGLVGSMLGSKDEALPGYASTFSRKGPEEAAGGDPNRLATPQPANAASAGGFAPATPGTGTAPAEPTTFVSNGDTEPPQVTLLGGSSVTLSVGDSYSDMGVLVTDNLMPTPVAHAYVNGAPVANVSINTNAPGSYNIVYTVQDAAGNHAQTSRNVTVMASGGGGAPPAPEPAPEPPPASDPPPASPPDASGAGGDTTPAP